ncbi:MAG TPA: coenzyme F420-0:L-glutamate ligase, partial [Candidatus Polarisedimenticolaceae bacterium]|nr:coenzyme F420-0:L-glutamate ligase [Candidatus Polarisedimenticolaceae bacterium]
MIIRAIGTSKVVTGGGTLLQLLDSALTALGERSIVAITSKVVSLCEGRVVSIEGTDKQRLIQQESDYYLPAETSKYQLHLAIVRSTMAPEAGIDESNGNGNYVLWPADPQASANQVRRYLAERFELKEVGVVITDSTCTPLRLGTTGVALAHSGFAAIHSYVGKPDLFGRPFGVSQSNIAGGLAAAAVLVMGEGAERTPLVIIEEASNITFQPRDPNPEELK